VQQSAEICSYQFERKATKIVYSNYNIWHSCCQRPEGHTKSRNNNSKRNKKSKQAQENFKRGRTGMCFEYLSWRELVPTSSNMHDKII